MEVYNQAIGIDVSKATLDVYHSSENTGKQFPNDDKGIAKLIEWIGKGDNVLVIFEPSGGYERFLQYALLSHSISCSKVNARQIRNFARAIGRLAKTDKIDAEILAHYGLKMQPRTMVIPEEKQRELAEYVKRRRQLIDMLVEERNRLDKSPGSFAKESTERVLAVLKEELNNIDCCIEEFIESSDKLKQMHNIVLQVKGIGKVVAAVLIAELPELGIISNKQISSLVGVAPHNKDSGTVRGQRHISGGRKTVRCALYMATLSAIRFDDRIKGFYNNLRIKGKPAKVAITACMHKLIIIINAKLRDEFYQINP